MIYPREDQDPETMQSELSCVFQNGLYTSRKALIGVVFRERRYIRLKSKSIGLG